MDNDKRLRLIRKLKSEGKTGAAIVRALSDLDSEKGRERLSRPQFIELMTIEMSWSQLHASTYYNNYYKLDAADGSEAEKSDVPQPEQFPVSSVRETLTASTDSAVEWYLSRSREVSRKDFEAKGRLRDEGRGAVYSYHFGDDDRDETIYVGITGAKVKSRLYTVTSPHAKAAWWSEWNYMRFVPVECSGDRQVLELLLIVGLGPLVNRKPSAINIDHFLYE